MDTPQKFNFSEIITPSPIDNLDTVLNYFATGVRNESMVFTRQVYFDFKNEGSLISESALQVIINKLVKDEFVSLIHVYTEKSFKITFEGLVFHQQGGYKQKLVNDNFIKSQQDSNKKTQKILFWFTGIVAIGTLISAIYYCIEIWRFFHPLIPANNGKFN